MPASSAKTRVLMDGIGLGESPRWHEGRLWFSDWVAHEVIALNPSGGHDVMAEVDAFPFSIDWLPEGPLLITAGQELLRMEPDGSLATHVDLRELSEHGWNEIVVDDRGNAYINSVGFDLMGGEDPSPGMIALVTPDGQARQVADGLQFPNGMAVTPDDSTLIVAESYEGRLTAFDIGTDGGLSNRRVWADLGEGGDGICIDAEGAVWSPKFQSCVRVREGGEVLETIELDRFCFACMLGGEDGGTLFMNVAEWTGPEGIFREPRTGQVLAVDAPAPHSGHP
jgi:sugar lactone lactonase YvrE